MMPEKTHWKKLENPDYLGAYAFQPGQTLIVTIKSVRQEDVYNPSSNGKETCTVAHFTENVKPMILNVTNCKTITKIYDTPYIEDWAGKQIEIYVAKVRAFGDTVEALRIKPRKPVVERIICERCGDEIKPAAGKTASELAEISKRNTGKKLCLDCMRKVKEEQDGGKRNDPSGTANSGSGAEADGK